MSDLHVFRKAPKLSFRGIKAPVLEDRSSFRHENIQHPIQYRDRQFIESTGLKNWIINVRLAFRKGISVPGYGDLYPTVFQQFVVAFENRAPGILIDPVLGQKRVKPVSILINAAPDKADGVDVDAEFIEAPEDIQPADDGAPKNTAEMTDQAAAFDQQIELAYRRWQEPPPDPTVNPLSAINSIGRQVERQGNKISAALHGVAFRAEQIEETTRRLEQPDKSQAIRVVRRLRDSALQLAKRVREPQKVIVRVIANTDAAINAVAADADMTVEAFIRLNPRLAQSGRVIQGSTYFKIKADGGSS